MIYILRPNILFRRRDNLHAYNIEFTIKYCDGIIYNNILLFLAYFAALILKGVNPLRYKYVNHHHIFNDEDIIISFWEPFSSNLPSNYTGKVIPHLMDFGIDSSNVSEIIKEYNIDLVIGHNNHQKHSEFFRYIYGAELSVIGLPFGFAPRFKFTTSFNLRLNKAAICGSINLVDDIYLSGSEVRDWCEFYNHEIYSHPFREKIRANLSTLSNLVDSFMPDYGEYKNWEYDSVAVLNKYKIFINDAGLANFPPARTFEGIACGSVMCAIKSDIYTELGFVDGINFIGLDDTDISELSEKLNFYLSNNELLYKMQNNSLKLSEMYSHSNVATILFNKLKDLV